MLVIACHEVWHVIVGLMFGGQLIVFNIDPNLGGYTNFRGPYLDSHRNEGHEYVPTEGVTMYHESNYQLTLLMGYFGSTLIGSCMVVSHLNS